MNCAGRVGPVGWFIHGSVGAIPITLSYLNKLTDLLIFISNAILNSGKQIFWMRKPSKFNVPGWNERAKELNARYRGRQ